MGMIYGLKIQCITCMTSALAENWTNTKFSLLHHLRNNFLSKQQDFDIPADRIALGGYVRI